jgi:hypothetical protein
MANTVSLLSYANTFGDWFVATNALAKENNDFAANNYVKPAGTLYLNAPTLGLQVANNAIVAGQLQVQGIGSSAYIQNNLTVDTQVYFSNTVLGLTNSGQANIGGPLLALASGTGLAVSNNATVGGSLSVANTLSVTRQTTLSNTLTVAKEATFSANVDIPNSFLNARYINGESSVNTAALNVTGGGIIGNNLLIGNNLSVGGQLSVTGNFLIVGTTVYSTNTFTLNANNTIGSTSALSVNRGVSGANAAIRWNEPSKYWDIRDVDNPTSYSKILTANLISNSLTSTSADTLASSNAANNLNTQIATTNTWTQLFVNTNLTSNVNVLTSWVNAANTNAANASYLSTGNVPLARVTGLYTGITGVGTLTNGTWTANTVAYQFGGTGTNAIPTPGAVPYGTGTALAYTTAGTSGQVLTSGGAGAATWTTATALNTTGAIVQRDSSGNFVAGTIQANLNGNATSANKVNTVHYPGTYLTGTGYDGSVQQTWAVDATTTNSASKVVARDASGNFAAGTITASLIGNVTGTATRVSNVLTPSTYIVGSAFDGSGAQTWSVDATTTNTASKVVARDGSGNFSAGTITANLSGNVTGTTGSFSGAVNIDNYRLVRYDGLCTITNPVNTNGVRFVNQAFNAQIFSCDNAGNVTAASNITAYSDERLKSNIKTIENALDKTCQLRGVTFEKDGVDGIGVIAQEIQKVLPEVVMENNDENKTLSVAYGNIVGVLIEAIKELKAEVDELKKNQK